jgi:hypothetical protein
LERRTLGTNTFSGALAIVDSIAVARVIWTQFAGLWILVEVNVVGICLVCLTCRNCSGFTSPLAIELRCDAIVSRLVIRTGIRLGNVNGVLGESVELVGNEKGTYVILRSMGFIIM